MAKKMCDLCQQAPAKDMRFGVNLCDACSVEYDKAVLGDPSCVARFSDPANFPCATPIAQKNIIAFIARRSGKKEPAQQVEQTAQEKQPEAVTQTVRTEDRESASVDSLYTNIGGKLKAWAKWIFIVEAIASVVGAIGMLVSAENGGMFFLALVTLVLGPVLAWVSSWILYAFGELVEKTVANEQNTRSILKLLQEKK